MELQDFLLTIRTVANPARISWTNEFLLKLYKLQCTVGAGFTGREINI